MLSVKLCLNSFFNTRQCNYQNQRVKFIKVLGNITHMLSCVHLLATPWTKGHQAPLPIERSWQEYWTGSPFPTPGVLPYPGIAPMSPESPALAGRCFTILCRLGSPSVEPSIFNILLSASHVSFSVFQSFSWVCIKFVQLLRLIELNPSLLVIFGSHDW